MKRDAGAWLFLMKNKNSLYIPCFPVRLRGNFE